MPKGYKTAKTISKEQAREALRQAVLKHMDEMVSAQVTHAKGIKYLVVREGKTGKFVRVTESMAKIKLGADEEQVEVWEKDPSIQAFTDLMNRTLDKPKEQPLEVDVNVSGLYDRIRAARERVKPS